MKNQIEQDIENLKKEIEERGELNVSEEHTGHWCYDDTLRAKLQQAVRDKKFFDEFVEKFNSDLFIYISECLREVDGININWRVLKKYAEDKLDNLAGEIKK